ncbi:sugar kinase [Paenibacillus psychroresistens]|uniref:Sugar kinase n=1 Tax=Paenibacillus psychroresistens TaxID=1778678 RepID=A0A6B8RR95_9BACL|nr:sugar kinase [Paenibacillus psychroresistens]QGQ98910.1 sugar kinase [Paenibacillus psychroresistens]
MKKRVFVLGELNVDLIVRGKDVTPEANKEKIVEHFEVLLGSSSAITAANLAGLGLQTALVSVVGDDDFGRFCIRRLEELGVDTSYILIDPKRTTGVTLALSDGNDRALLTYMGSIADLTLELIPDEVYQLADHIHFGSFFLQKNMRKSWIEVCRRAKLAGISTSFDVGWDPDELWDRETIKELITAADWFMPNEEEALHIMELNEIKQLIDEAGAFPHNGIAVKLGSRGGLLLQQDGSLLTAAPFQVTPIDTTGAGDSFNAGLIYAHLHELESYEKLMVANACGALSTLGMGGTGLITLASLNDFLQQQSKLGLTIPKLTLG